LLAVGCLSAASLAYEILLIRLFAIEHFHHFAYMAIGVAMLGFAASGALVAALGPPLPERRERWFAATAVATTIALIASPALVHLVRLDPTRLAWDAGHWLRLGLVYALLALPFGLGALATLIAFALEPQRPGRVYGASFFGAGAGSALALGALWVADPERAVAFPALLGGLGALLAARRAPGVLALAAAGAAIARPPWRLTITPYKALPQVEAYPDARRVAEHTSPLGWVAAVEAPAFRYAPGLSLGYRGAFPPQTALFVDGELAGAVTRWESARQALELLDWLPTAVPYALVPAARVLVVGAGSGLEVESALAHDARAVTAVELSPDLAQLVREGSARSAPAGAPADRVSWVMGDARGYVARSRELFDVIAIGASGALGTTAAGVHALSEDFLHTVDAYAAYLERLSDRGILAVTRWLTVPPREPVRVVLTAGEALRRVRREAAVRGLAVVRSWGTVTVLVKPSGFDAGDVAALRRWTAARQFDLDWWPGAAAPPDGLHALDEPTIFRAARAAVAGPDSVARFATTYPFAIAPVDDARPYPHQFMRLRSLGAFVGTSRGSWLPFAEWGSIALVVTLLQSVALGGLLFGAPLLARRGRPGAGGVRLVGYFLAIGVGYLAAELAAIQQLGLLLGHPVYAVAATLVAFLSCSGAGSTYADRLVGAGRRAALPVLVVGLVVAAVVLLPLVHRVQAAPLVLRAVIAALALAPLACLMGLPFPLGLRAFAGADPTRLAWAWAANGFASVVAAPLAALVALEHGSPALFLLAAGAYAAATLCGRLPKTVA
jgi:hypothetical protein